MNLLGYAEFLFVILLVFVIIGPKDLPKILFRLGQFVQVLRRLSDEFMQEFETIYHVNEIKKNEKDDKRLS